MRLRLRSSITNQTGILMEFLSARSFNRNFQRHPQRWQITSSRKRVREIEVHERFIRVWQEVRGRRDHRCRMAAEVNTRIAFRNSQTFIIKSSSNKYGEIEKWFNKDRVPWETISMTDRKTGRYCRMIRIFGSKTSPEPEIVIWISMQMMEQKRTSWRLSSLFRHIFQTMVPTIWKMIITALSIAIWMNRGEQLNSQKCRKILIWMIAGVSRISLKRQWMILQILIQGTMNANSWREKTNSSLWKWS